MKNDKSDRQKFAETVVEAVIDEMTSYTKDKTCRIEKTKVSEVKETRYHVTGTFDVSLYMAEVEDEYSSMIQSIEPTRRHDSTGVALSFVFDHEEGLAGWIEATDGAVCPICSKTCKNTRGLKIHMGRIHELGDSGE